MVSQTEKQTNRGRGEVSELEERSALIHLLRAGKEKLTEDEKRALQVDSDEAGGFTIAPQNVQLRPNQSRGGLEFHKELGYQASGREGA